MTDKKRQYRAILKRTIYSKKWNYLYGDMEGIHTEVLNKLIQKHGFIIKRVRDKKYLYWEA